MLTIFIYKNFRSNKTINLGDFNNGYSKGHFFSISPSFISRTGFRILRELVVGQKIKENEINIFSDIFSNQYGSIEGGEKFKEQVVNYIGSIKDGEHIQEKCQLNIPIKYHQESEKNQAIRTVAANLQYLGIITTAIHLPIYARYFDWTQKDYEILLIILSVTIAQRILLSSAKNSCAIIF